MTKLTCRDYGYDCDFVIEGDAEEVIKKFAEHTLEEHGIEYSSEILMQFIMRKDGS